MSRKTSKKTVALNVETIIDNAAESFQASLMIPDEVVEATLNSQTEGDRITVAPVATTDVTPVAPVAHGDRWKATVAKARASFNAGKAFRAGSNRAIAYDLLCRNEGVSVAEYRAQIRNPNRPDASLAIEFGDVATISQRKLVRTIVDGVKRYTLDVAYMSDAA